jgi:hypothetical protein
MMTIMQAPSLVPYSVREIEVFLPEMASVYQNAGDQPINLK